MVRMVVFMEISWFRDISGDADYINSILNEQKFLKNKLKNLEDIVDNLPYPVWLRNPSLGLSQVNKKYMEFVNNPDKNNIIINGIVIEEDNNEKYWLKKVKKVIRLKLKISL